MSGRYWLYEYYNIFRKILLAMQRFHSGMEFVGDSTLSFVLLTQLQ